MIRCPRCKANELEDFAIEERTRYVRQHTFTKVDPEARRIEAEDDPVEIEDHCTLRVACLSCGHSWVPKGWKLKVV